jgi:CBS domain-containing protein
MKARDLMTQPVFTVRPDASVAEVATVMIDRHVGCVPVVDAQGKLCGIITQTDFGPNEQGVPFSMEAVLQMFSRSLSSEAMQRVRREARTTTARDIMVTEVITDEEDTPIEEMARRMLRYDIDHIAVVRDQVPVGIVARHDFLRAIAGQTRCG